MKYGQLADNALHDSGRTHNNVEQNMYTVGKSSKYSNIYKKCRNIQIECGPKNDILRL